MSILPKICFLQFDWVLSAENHSHCLKQGLSSKYFKNGLKHIRLSCYVSLISIRETFKCANSKERKQTEIWFTKIKPKALHYG